MNADSDRPKSANLLEMPGGMERILFEKLEILVSESLNVGWKGVE
jgi:hypothetical protein